MSKSDLLIIEAFQKGYRVENGEIFNHLRQKVNFWLQSTGYPAMAISRRPVKVHRFVAYQKFGNAIFEKGIQVRHLNGNKLDFSFENISIGTAKENNQDKPIEQRKHTGYLCNLKKRKLSIEQATKIRNEYSLLTKKRGFIKATAITCNVSNTVIYRIIHHKGYFK